MPLVIKRGFHPVVPTKGRVRVHAPVGARLAFDATKQEAKKMLKKKLAKRNKK